MNPAVERLHRPTIQQVDRAIAQHRPSIFTGLMDEQPASAWDLPGLRQRLGARPVQVVSNGRPRISWDPKRGLAVRSLSFQEFADRLSGQGGAAHEYLQDDINSVPALKADYRLPPCLGARPFMREKLWLGGDGLITPLHYDPAETFHWVIRGAKRFLCYPPGVTRYYPYPTDSDAPFISQVDPDDPRPRDFPRFRAAVPTEFTLHAGEILYLPAFWWHQVYSRETFNLSLNFVWFASTARNVRHLGQYLRARRHIARSQAAARAKQEAADAEAAGSREA
jgi:hypothetical protein